MVFVPTFQISNQSINVTISIEVQRVCDIFGSDGPFPDYITRIFKRRYGVVVD